MIGRILRSVDFERVLGRPSCARSPHFAIHFLAQAPWRKVKARAVPGNTELSTVETLLGNAVVDESAPACIWLGSVVPKRHARRAATRNLIKRQIRQAVGRQAEGVPGQQVDAGMAKGLWVVRLRSPFDKQKYPSASSEALSLAAAEELSTVLAQAVQRVGA